MALQAAWDCRALSQPYKHSARGSAGSSTEGEGPLGAERGRSRGLIQGRGSAPGIQPAPNTPASLPGSHAVAKARWVPSIFTPSPGSQGPQTRPCRPDGPADENFLPGPIDRHFIYVKIYACI